MDTTQAPIEQALVRLNDGRMMPQLGFGTWKIQGAEGADLVRDAIAAGYKAIDTATAYDNEREVGEGIRASGAHRDELFVTTKLWNDAQGFDETLAAFAESEARLGIGPVDLYLIHWPHPQAGRFVDTWKAFIRLQEEGRVKSIGVSNFRPQDLERIIDDTGVKPVLNQIECHPRFQQIELRAWLDENGIATQSWSPLGQGDVLKEPAIARVADKHGRSPAQVILRWHLDQGLLAIPKASDRAHMVDNLAIGGFALDEEDMAAIAALDDEDGRVGPHPDTF